MNKTQALAILADPVEAAARSFELLKTITRLTNNVATLVDGRELVIRALAIQDAFAIQERILLDMLVRAVGLYPYAEQEYCLSLLDQIAIEAHRIDTFGEDLKFHSLQLQIYKIILSGRNVVLSATTSVGKSMIIDAIIASKKFRTVVIVVPTIALIDETRRRLLNRFRQSWAIITHPSQLRDPSRRSVYVLTQERALARKDLDNTEFFVIDEFYKLDLTDGTNERAVDLNLCFHRLSNYGAQYYLIGPNIDAIKGLSSGPGYHFIPSHFSTVAVDIKQFNLSKKGPDRKIKLIELCVELTSPTLIFCQSPNMAGEAATALIESGKFKKAIGFEDALDWMKSAYPEQWIVIQALEYGIGIHHANVPRAIQQFMIRCFESKLITKLVCTSTIIEGVNTVAENVIMFDRRIKQSNVNYFTYKNITGRAGRMGKYFIGKVFILEAAPIQQDFEVKIPERNADTGLPASFILDTPITQLSENSIVRLESYSKNTGLSLETLRINRHIDVDAQGRIAAELAESFLFSPEDFVWNSYPRGHQLRAVCNLIYDQIDQGKLLKSFGVTSGSGLAAELATIQNSENLRAYIDRRLEFRPDGQSVSDSVENTLKFIRKYLTYTFPRQLNAVSNIQAEVARKLGAHNNGDYSFYSSRVESLFMDSGFYALDEYGIPVEVLRKIAPRNSEKRFTVDEAMEYIAQIDTESLNLHPFEIQMISRVRDEMV